MIMFGPRLRQGDAQGAISAERFEIPLAGGAALFAAWGEPSRPGVPPAGGMRKGEIKRDFLWLEWG
jgi:hypothetical protein